MKSIIVWIYGIVKAYMLDQAKQTENQAFVDQLMGAFNGIELIWANINKAQQQTPPVPPPAAPKV